MNIYIFYYIKMEEKEEKIESIEKIEKIEKKDYPIKYLYLYWKISTIKNYNYSKYGNVIVENKLYDIEDKNKNRISHWCVKTEHYEFLLNRIYKNIDRIEIELDDKNRSVFSYICENYRKNQKYKDKKYQYILYELLLQYINLVYKTKESLTDILLNGLYYYIKEVIDYIINIIKINNDISIIDINQKINDKSIYELSILFNNKDLLNLILDYTTEDERLKIIDNINGIPINSITYLIMHNEYEIALKLLKKIKITYKNVKEIFDMACYYRNYNIVKYIMNHINDEEMKLLLDVKYKNLPLYNLVNGKLNNTENLEIEIMILNKMIEKEVNYKYLNKEKMSLLIIIALNNREDLVYILFEQVKTDIKYINNIDINNNTAIFMMINNGMYNIVKKMLELENINVKTINKANNNIFHFYVMNNNKNNDEIQTEQINIILKKYNNKELKKYINIKNKNKKDIITILNEKNNNKLGNLILSNIYIK